MEDTGICLSKILDIGELLLVSGAEVNRVEDTIRRIASAYGFVRTDVFTITSSIVVTAICADSSVLTQTRRITGYTTDMHRIERLNALSREVCASPLPVPELEARIAAIREETPYSSAAMFVFYGLVAGVFTVFFGGALRDGAASVLCGLLLKLLMDAGKRIQLQNLVLTMLGSFVVGAAATLFVWLGLGANFDSIVIGNIMLLIPGVSFTVSLRDMISGDTISGLLGLCESILKAMAIAIGFALVISFWGGIVR